jgi:hypothetical protein
MDLPADATGRGMHVCRLGLSRWIGRIQQYADDSGIRHQLIQKLEAFRFQESSELNDASRVPARPVDAGDEARLDRINGTREDDRDGRRPKISFTTTMIPISAMQAKCTTRQNRRSCCLPAPSAARAQYCLAGLRRLELRYPCASHVFEMS